MATTIVGKLNKAATQFQAGESTGFGIRLGVKYYDRESKADAYTNYEAVVFAKSPMQIQFYQQALIEGSIVEVSGEKQRIRQFQGQNGLSLSIELLDAKLGFVHAPQSSNSQAQAPQQQRQQPQQQPQQSYNQPRQQPPAGYQPQIGQPMQQGYQNQPNPTYGQAQQSGGGVPDFDPDIPF
jgi:single-strand DNA-binding protein